MQIKGVSSFTYFISICTGILFLNTGFSQTYADAIVGKWRSSDGKTKVEIYKSGNTYSGKIIWLSVPNDEHGNPRTDKENPESSLRKRPLIGLQVLHSLKYEDGFWQDGKIYSSQNGKSYTCDIWLEGNDVLKMKVYWHFIYQIEEWTRVK